MTFLYINDFKKSETVCPDRVGLRYYHCGCSVSGRFAHFVDIRGDGYKAKVAGIFAAYSSGFNLVRSQMIVNRQLGQSGVAVGSLSLDITGERGPTNSGGRAAATANCISFFNETIIQPDPVNPFAGPITQAADGWQIRANPSFC